MTEFEDASTRYVKAKLAYWRAEQNLAIARGELTAAERERSAAFNKEVGGARSRRHVKDAPHD